VEVVCGELNDSAALQKAVSGCASVFHLAAELRDPTQMDRVNIEGTRCLIEMCNQAGVRKFIHLSSVGVIGARGAAGLLDETAPAHPRNAYEISKYAGERAALLHHNVNGIQVMVVRPTIVYGENRNPHNDSFLAWVRAIKSRRFIQIGRDYISSYVYVGDVAAACLAVANDIRSGGEVYIVNEPVMLSTFIDELSVLLDVKKPGVLIRPVGILSEKVLRQTGRFASLYNHTTYSMDKLAKLGFTLPFGYRVGLRRTVQWYREKGLL
jgi:nucleoside-diphosphate-sugar epimerase